MLPMSSFGQDSIFVEKCDDFWYQFSDDWLYQTDLRFYEGNIVVKVTTNGFIWNYGVYTLLAGRCCQNADTLHICYDWEMTVDSIASYGKRHFMSNFRMDYGVSFEMMQNELYLIHDSGLVWLKPIQKKTKFGRKERKQIAKDFIDQSKSTFFSRSVKSLTDSMVVSPELGYVTLSDSSSVHITYSKYDIAFEDLIVDPVVMDCGECIILPGQPIGYMIRSKRKYKCTYFLFK